MKRSTSLIWCGVGSLLLGLLTAGLIGFAENSHHCSPRCIEIADIASIPAFLIARIFFPEGVHTGRGAPEWGAVFLVAGVLFYTGLWFVIICLLTRRRRRERPDIG